MIYWDYAAAAPPYDEVARTVEQLMRLHYANPSSLHRAGAAAAALIERAREVCAAALGVLPGKSGSPPGRPRATIWPSKAQPCIMRVGDAIS